MLVFLKKDECMERCAHPSPFISLDRSSSAVLSSARTPPNDNTWWQLLKMKDLFLVRPSPAQRCISHCLVQSKFYLDQKTWLFDLGFVSTNFVSCVEVGANAPPNDNTWWQLLKMKYLFLVRPSPAQRFILSLSSSVKILVLFVWSGVYQLSCCWPECLPMTTFDDSCSRWKTLFWSGHSLHKDEFGQSQKCVSKNN